MSKSVNKAIGLNFLRILSYPSALVADTRALPNRSGIYYAVKDSEVLYIGEALNLKKRWSGNNHKQKERLIRMGGVVLFYRFAPEYRLLLEEAKEIQLFDPPLNKQKPKPATHDRGLVRVDSIARDAFWTFTWGMAIALPFALFAIHSKTPTPTPQSVPQSVPQPLTHSLGEK